MDEIAKFSIVDEKTKFTILDEIWTKNDQMIGVIAEKKLSNSFTFIGVTIMLFTVGSKEWTPRAIGMRMD